MTHAESGMGTTCAPILRALPRWFGIDEATQHYIDFVDDNLTFIAEVEDQAVGFLSVARPFPAAAEIYVMGVLPDYHGQGIGRTLIAQAEAHLRADRVRFLQVKTLSEQHPSPEYAQTRAFYTKMGFTPLQVFPELWSADNPCLQMIKTLS
ncbi:MAG: GNAT family N-acetyltransferase [Chloroflexota bacterium]